MKTIIISFFAAITAMIVSFLKGGSSAKQGDKLDDDQATLKIISDEQETVNHVDNLSGKQLDGELHVFSKEESAK